MSYDLTVLDEVFAVSAFVGMSVLALVGSRRRKAADGTCCRSLPVPSVKDLFDHSEIKWNYPQKRVEPVAAGSVKPTGVKE